jgi:hypothetical protein
MEAGQHTYEFLIQSSMEGNPGTESEVKKTTIKYIWSQWNIIIILTPKKPGEGCRRTRCEEGNALGATESNLKKPLSLLEAIPALLWTARDQNGIKFPLICQRPCITSCNSPFTNTACSLVDYLITTFTTNTLLLNDRR